MPHVSKQSLSQFIRTDCQRQLRLNLSPSPSHDAERAAEGMPAEQPPRPGLEYLKRAGIDWQALKIEELDATFGTAALVGDRTQAKSGRVTYRRKAMLELLARSTPGTFLVEAEYSVGPAFERALAIEHCREKYGLDYANARPDLIQVALPKTFASIIDPRGDVARVSDQDDRVQLRVIDIKLTAEPSPSYFSEVTYYSMLLAGVLEDAGLGDRYAVASDGAVWPGSHDRSQLYLGAQQAKREGVTLTCGDLCKLFESDLEQVPFEVFAPRIRRFLTTDVSKNLDVQDWRDLPWHVDNRCKGCDYLGYPWKNRDGESTALEDHCMPMAKTRDDLSRVAFITRGSKAALHDSAVATVNDLSTKDSSDAVFDSHQSLRASRTVVATRALALQGDTALLAPNAGTSAVMPGWADLRIYATADFDVGSAITLAFGLKAFWIEPTAFGQRGARETHAWRDRVFVIDEKDPLRERRELLAFLTHIHTILTDAQQRHGQTRFQIYMWDELQYQHLVRVIGRHLPWILADGDLRYLAWLFPPEEIVPNPALADAMQTPLTIVRDVVRAVLAAPVAHYYSLFEVARRYHYAGLPEGIARFSTHPLFEDLLSDQIPSERAHEIWTRATSPRHWSEQVATLRETVSKRLNALESVTRRLSEDLRGVLTSKAPLINVVGPVQPQARLSVDSQLWYAHALLNSALDNLEVQQIWAMPPHEREARFKSAHLTERLRGDAERDELARLGIAARANRRVYRVDAASRELRVRENDFNFALAPRDNQGFLNERLNTVASRAGWDAPERAKWKRMAAFLGVNVVEFDRDRGIIVLDMKGANGVTPDLLETVGAVNLSSNVMLDPTYTDFFTSKLLAALTQIGNPQIAAANPLVPASTGLTSRARVKRSYGPAAEMLWTPRVMRATGVDRETVATRDELKAAGVELNDSQWQAWNDALTRRLSLIWGPPGTGKSQTLRAVVLGAVMDAVRKGQPLRVLICCATYRALDNVFLRTASDVRRALPDNDICVARLRGSYSAAPLMSDGDDVVVDAWNPSAELLEVHGRLRRNDAITVIGTTQQQIHKLATLHDQPAEQPFFDLIVIDEASQMDVANSILALTTLAPGGAVVLAGDPRQLPPIHAAEAPATLQTVVGSVFEFFSVQHGIETTMLNRNYRSNAEIVDFVRTAGYRDDLQSENPTARLHLATVPDTKPAYWPDTQAWSDEYAAVLDPSVPVCCFVYPDGRSSQWNLFEAESIAALVSLLQGRLADPLTNEPYDEKRFWEEGLGIVTPHRAQQALVVSRLQSRLPGTSAALIRGAVDTVERFQGQERDIMIASFALGDADAINSEDEFLHSLNRFNVIASRARTKLIVLVSEEVVNHLSSDLEVLHGSRLLKSFVDSFCRSERSLALPYNEKGVFIQKVGVLRYR